MSCPVCHKGLRAVHYCRRPDCGLMSAVHAADTPEHAKFNEFLARAKAWEAEVRALADAAYGIAQTESIGPKRDLLRIAHAATDFADAMQRTRPL